MFCYEAHFIIQWEQLIKDRRGEICDFYGGEDSGRVLLACDAV